MKSQQLDQTFTKLNIVTTIKIFVLTTIFIFLFIPIYKELFHDWLFFGDFVHSDNSHAVIVPFISAYIIWKNRRNIPWNEANTSKIGLFILIVSLVVYLIAFAGGIKFVARITMLTTMIGLSLYNLGIRIFKFLSFPILFLFFMIPIPYSIISLVSIPLQAMVTSISGIVLRDVLGLPVFREGNMLFFSTTSLEVAEACSGIRSLVTFVMLGVLFAKITNGSMIGKFIFVIMSIPLSIFTNLLRVIGTGILAHYFGSIVAKGFLHEFSGIFVFGTGIVMMIGIRKLIEWFELKICKTI